MKKLWTLGMLEQLLRAEGKELSDLSPQEKWRALEVLTGAFPLLNPARAALRMLDPDARRRWTAEERRLVRELYPDTATEAIAAMLGRSVLSIYQEAQTNGLHKSPSYRAAQKEETSRRLAKAGAAHRYPKGHVPANKGMKGRPSTGRMAETQFKKGQMAGAAQKKWQPVGTVVVDPDGYHKVKVNDDHTVTSRFNWRFCHVLLWEEHNGPVPAGNAVVFKDGNRSNITIENLECITRTELMKRNTIQNLPAPIKEVIRLTASIRRKVRKIREEQSGGPAQPSLRGAGKPQGSRQAHGDRARPGRRHRRGSDHR